MRVCQVVEVIDLSPHVRRIILGGESLKDFPKGKEGASIKLLLPDAGQKKSNLKLSQKKLSARSYTVRSFDAKKRRLSLEITVNTHQGRFSQWASGARVGDYVGISEPGSKKHKTLEADWHLFVADLTGLPALAATLKQLPADAKGYAVIQVPSKEDTQKLERPKQLKIKWVIADQGKSKKLLKAVKKLRWLKGESAIFIAAEKKQVLKIKKYVLKQPDINKKYIYASGYWRKK